MASLNDIWNQPKNKIPWDQWLQEIEALSDQQEIEKPATEELEQLYSQGTTPLEALLLQES